MGESWAREGAGMQRGKWPKAGAAEAGAGERKEEKREPTREKEKGPNPEARARGEGGRQRNWGGHMKHSPGSVHLPGQCCSHCLRELFTCV